MRVSRGTIVVVGPKTQYAPGSTSPLRWPSTYLRPCWYSKIVTRRKPSAGRAAREHDEENDDRRQVGIAGLSGVVEIESSRVFGGGLILQAVDPVALRRASTTTW
jgi:hypothetical protein